MTTNTLTRTPKTLDYELVFKLTPGMCLVLDASFTILAQNRDHAQATLSIAKDVVGQNLFAVFPDNPGDSGADGVSAVRASLLKVLKTREADAMPVVRYDVKAERGPYQKRYWQITNTPILGEDGYVRWIINRAENVTEMIELRAAVARAARPVGKQGALAPVISAEMLERVAAADATAAKMQVTIYHNPQCGTSRAVLALLRERGAEPRIVEYLKAPLNRAELKTLIARMGVTVRDVVRWKEPLATELKLEGASDSALLDAMAAHPILMNRPIVVTDKGVKLCRPSETVEDLL